MGIKFWSIIYNRSIGIFIQVVIPGGLVARLSGCVFYGNALISLILTWKFISSWKYISVLWTLSETTGGLNFPPDLTIKRRVIIVSWNFTICAIGKS